MKVIGTGTPEVAHVCFEACEVQTLRAELERIGAELPQEPTFEGPLRHPGIARDQREYRIAARAIERLTEATAALREDVPVEVEGPFDLIRDIVWSGLGRVAADLQQAVMQQGVGEVDAIVSAARTALAWAETAADLDYVENHGLGASLGLDDAQAYVRA